MNHIQTNFSSFFSKIMIGAMLAFLFIVVGLRSKQVNSFWRQYNKCNNCIDYFVILMLLVASILQYRFTDKQFLIFLISTSIVVRLSMVLFVYVPVIDDMKAMFESAKQIAIGNSVENVAQLPFIIYESIIIRVFGDTVFALQLFNILFCTGTAFSFIVLQRWFWRRMRPYCFCILCFIYSKYIYKCFINIRIACNIFILFSLLHTFI